jgi:hypothetical protein
MDGKSDPLWPKAEFEICWAANGPVHQIAIEKASKQTASSI